MYTIILHQMFYCLKDEKHMSTLFKKLKAGLEDAIAYEQGKIDLRSEGIVLPKSYKNRVYSVRKRKRK